MDTLIAETSAEAQAKLAYKALEHQPSAILVISSAQVLKLLNPAAEALFGVSGGRVLGKPLSALIRNTDAVLEVLGESAAPGQSFTLRQQSLQVAGGGTLMVDLTCAAFDGGTDWVIEAQPLDRLRRINHDDRLINIQETTASLVRGLAHEVKNPLGGIRGAAQLLGHELQRPGLAEYTEVIIRETDRLTELVDRMLGPSRPLNITQVNVHQVLEHVARVAVESVANRQVHLKRDYDPSLPMIDADEDQLIQALLNIVNNACIALNEVKGPEITLRTRPLRQFTIHGRLHRLVVSIEVQDNGPGIPDELLDRMFYPMISGRASGSGLGLAITQAIVRRHHGMIECESRPGKTFFAVILPLAYEPESCA
ncbi:MAG: nitrogen regulation protein NR(II) [Gammaproteobacteria bacterium]|nr:nitrogen regulation protein NR(II) [Gammaproteobacteria bacterium]